jgi:hypothetical protein
MTLAYEKLLEKHNLEVSELPKDAQIVIKELVLLKGQLSGKVNIGQKLSPESLSRLRIKDEVVVDKIFDYLDEKGEDSDEDNEDEDEETEDEPEDKDNDNDNNEIMEGGVIIDGELNGLFKSGKTEISITELRSIAPATYDCIFDNYEQDGSNGIETSNFSFIETSANSETFKLNKKQ